MIGFCRHAAIRDCASPREAGFTLIEMLVAVLISNILAGILLGVVLSSESSANTSTQSADLTAEARTALNRMSTDLAEAVPLTVTSASGTTTTPAITAVANPDGPTYSSTSVTSVTFDLDANGDGCIAGVASNNLSPVTTPSPAACTATSTTDPNNPETETFCWPGGTSGNLYLLATSPSAAETPVTSCGNGTPLLAGKVTGFEIFYRSSLYLYQDASGKDPQSGITTWYDLDHAGSPVGNSDGSLDLPELENIDSVIIELTMQENGHTETFQTQVSLRNVHPND